MNEQDIYESLKPCPLCDGKAEWSTLYSNFTHVEPVEIISCKDCGLQMRDLKIEVAYEKWQRRNHWLPFSDQELTDLWNDIGIRLSLLNPIEAELKRRGAI